MPRLPILEIIIAANVFVWRERRDFLSLAFPAIAVLAFLIALGGWFAGSRLDADTDTFTDVPVGPLAVVLLVAIAFFWIAFAVAWHRRYLVAGESTTVREALRWGRRQTRFFLRAIAVYALLLGAWLLLVLIGSLAGAAASAAALLPLVLVAPLVAALYGFARLAPLFPATAVDDPLTFADCWALTHGHGWRLVVIVLLVAAPVTLLGIAIGSLVVALLSVAAGLGNLTVSFISALVDQTLGFVGIAVGVSALSIAYERLTGGAGRGGPPQRLAEGAGSAGNDD